MNDLHQAAGNQVVHRLMSKSIMAHTIYTGVNNSIAINVGIDKNTHKAMPGIKNQYDRNYQVLLK